MPKSFLFALTSFVLIFGGCQDSGLFSEGSLSDPIRISEESSFFILSETFARQLEAFDFDFGDFKIILDFLGFLALDSVGDTAQIDVLSEGVPVLTVFELQLPLETSYDDTINSIKESSAVAELVPAVFGADSFYFLQDGSSVNVLPFGKNVLAFKFAVQDFEKVRSFISSLLIFR